MEEKDILKQKASCQFIMTEVKSSNVKAIGYNEVNSIVKVQFNNGNAYAYFDVPKTDYMTLLESESKGKAIVTFAKKFKLVRIA